MRPYLLSNDDFAKWHIKSLKNFWSGRGVALWLDGGLDLRSDMVNGLPRAEWQRRTGR